MEDIIESGIESGIESAVSGLIEALVSFIVANIGLLLLIIAVAAIALFVLALNVKQRTAKRIVQSALQLQQSAATRLNETLVSDAFRELELGLSQGETDRRMRDLQQSVYALGQEATALGQRIGAYRPAFFALAEPIHEAKQLEREAEHLTERAELVFSELSKVRRQLQGASQAVNELRARLIDIDAELAGMIEETGYPLTVLQEGSAKLAEQLSQAERVAAFDAVQARPLLEKLRRGMNVLGSQVQAVKKQAAALPKLRSQMEERRALLAQRMEGSRPPLAEGRDPAKLLAQADAIMAQLVEWLRHGHEVDLNEAQADLERIWREAAVLLERAAHAEQAAEETRDRE